MSEEHLPCNQAERLLHAMHDGEECDKSRHDDSPSTDAFHRVDSPHIVSAIQERRSKVDDVSPRPQSTPAVSDYDFRQPPQLGKETLRGIHEVCERASAQVSDRLNELMRGDSSARLTGVAQCGHHDYVYELKDPSCNCAIDLRWCDSATVNADQWMLNIPPTLLFAMLDRMLGGEPCPTETTRREMTDIEVRLIRRVVEAFLAATVEAWSPIAKPDLQVDSIESHPRHLVAVGPNDRVVKACFDVSICHVRGEMTLCIPIDTVQAHAGALSDPNAWANTNQHATTPETQSTIGEALSQSSIEVVVNLARSTIRTSDLLGLSVGDIIATEKESTAPLELAIQDVPKFTAKAGAYQGKKAVQIESVIDQ